MQDLLENINVEKLTETGLQSRGNVSSALAILIVGMWVAWRKSLLSRRANAVNI